MKPSNAPLRPILMAIAITALSSGCTKKAAPPPAPASTQPAAQASAPPPASAEVLSLLDFRIAKNEAGKTVLIGNVSNSSLTKIDRATVTFSILDKSGNEIGTTMASVANLNARFSWTFEVEIAPAGAASAKLIGFTTK